MKKRLLLLLFAALSLLPSFAYDFTVDGIYYDKTGSSTCRVTCVALNRVSYSGAVIIPESVSYNGVEYSVTSIGESAFKVCYRLTSVTIPNSVTSIGSSAFDGCSGLTSVTIPNSVTSIGDAAFRSCSGLTSITIPNSVTSIGNDAFYGCSGITELTIEDGSKTLSIGYNFFNSKGLFYDCPLESLYLGRNLSYTSSDYRHLPFRGKTTLKSVSIGNYVTSIGEYAFNGCSGLTSVTIPNSVTSIDNYAFDGCSGITELTIEDGSETLSIGYNSYSKGLFYDCPLESLYLGRNLSYYTSSYYGYSPFYGKTTLKSVSIGNYVTSIGSSAFLCCSGLTSVTIPNSVTSIGESAFHGCSGLTSVTIPNSVTSIGNYTFSGCSGLISVTIPNSVTSIGNYAFNGCSGITELTIEDGPKTLSIGYNSNSRGFFYDCPLESLYLGRNLYYNTSSDYGYPPFYEKTTLKSVSIGNSVTDIGESAFNGCTGLTSVVIPNSVTSIGEYAFYGCSGLSSVTIPNSVTSIGNYAFSRCSGLTSVTIPNSVTSIGNDAFYRCSGITELTIEDGSETLSIGYNSNSKGLFYDCPLESLYLGRNLYYYTSSNCGYSPFYEKTTLKSVSIGNYVTYIGHYSFYGCSGLTSVTIPNSVTSIGNYEFYGCSGLTSVTIPNSVTKIGNYTFSGCSGLTSVTIPNSVTSIGKYAFAGTNKLSEIFSEAITAPAISDNTFSEQTYMGAIVFTPAGSLNSYQTKWSKFYHLIGEPVERDFTIEQAGSLMNKLTLSEVNNITSLKLSGKLNGTDLLTLNKIPNIQRLDLSEATIVSGGMNYYEEDNVKYGTEDNALGNYWAYALSALQEVKLPKNLVKLGERAFRNKTMLRNLTIPASVTSIENYAFANCSNLTSLTLEDGEESLTLGNSGSNNGIFDSCPIDTLYLGRDLTYASGCYPFKDKTTLKNLTVGEMVSSIGESAFSGCTGLSAVSIPASVTSIENYAFANCSNVTSLTLEDGEGYLTLGNNGSNKGLFDSCPIDTLYLGRDLTYASECSPFKDKTTLKKLTVGKMVSLIGNYAFYGCNSLSSVSLGERVQFIRNYAFYGCNSLSSFSRGEKVTSIGDYAFYGCNSLSSVSLGERVSSIGDYAFYGCDGIPSIAIPSMVSSIGNSAFENCSKLGAVHITDLDSWLHISFKNSAANPLAYAHHLILNGSEVTDLVIPESETSIGQYVFYSCLGLNSVIIPSSITHIGRDAFAGCSGLTTTHISDLEKWFDITFVTMASNPLRYGRQLYVNETELTELTIPASVSAVKAYSFASCSGLKSLIIPASVKSIGNSAFYYCNNITNMSIEDGLTELALGSDVFAASSVSDLYIGRNFSGNLQPFKGFNTLKSLTFGSPVNEISDNSFRNCTNLTDVSLSSSTKIIGRSAFEECISLSELVIPNSVQTIERGSFYNCSALSSLSIPKSVLTIGDEAFRGCKQLTDLTIEDGEQTLEIGYNYDSSKRGQFADCPIKTVHLGRNISYSYSPFQKITSLRNITIGSNVSRIGNSLFSGCSGLTTLTLPASVKTIGSSAFSGCSGLASVVLPMGITELNESVFSFCSSLASVTVPGGVRYIRSGAFKGCSRLESVNMINPIPAVIEEDSFDFKGTLNVPAESKMYYWIHPLWSKFPELEAWNVGSDVDFAENSVTYHITSNESATVEITAAAVSGANQTGVLVIPEIIEFDGTEYAVAGVANDAFRDTKIESVELPATIAYVGVNAFNGCSQLKSLRVKAEIPPSVAHESFDNSAYSSVELIVDEHAENAYKEHSVWSLFENRATENISSISVIPSEVELTEGETAQLSAELTNMPEGAVVNWASSDETVVSVDETGLITAISEGVAVITASCNGREATIPVRVNRRLNPSIVVSPTEVELTEGETFQLKAELTDMPEDSVIEWKSSDETVVSVDETGLITAISEGDAVIIASCNNLGAIAVVRVKAENAVNPTPTPDDEDGLNEIDADAEIEVYDLKGVKIAESLERLPKGIYIVRQGAKVSKVAI